MTPLHTQSVGSVGEKWFDLQDKHHIVTIFNKKKINKKKRKEKKRKNPLILTFKYSTLAKTMFSF